MISLFCGVFVDVVVVDLKLPIVSVLDPGWSGPGSGPGRGHCVVFLGKSLYSHSAFLHPGV